ncbi:hypothetical protein ACC676_39310, partial [Rhizobium ruizarguesonis]
NSGYMTGKKSDVMDKYATAALPKADGVPQTVSLGGWSLGIPSSSERQTRGAIEGRHRRDSPVRP